MLRQTARQTRASRPQRELGMLVLEMGDDGGLVEAMWLAGCTKNDAGKRSGIQNSLFPESKLGDCRNSPVNSCVWVSI